MWLLNIWPEWRYLLSTSTYSSRCFGDTLYFLKVENFYTTFTFQKVTKLSTFDTLQMIHLRFYIPLDTKQVISETFSQLSFFRSVLKNKPQLIMLYYFTRLNINCHSLLKYLVLLWKLCYLHLFSCTALLLLVLNLIYLLYLCLPILAFSALTL